MKTRCQALVQGALAAGFCMMAQALEVIDKTDDAVSAARDRDKDIIYFYYTPDTARLSAPLLQALAQSPDVDALLSERFILVPLELPLRLTGLTAAEKDSVRLALKHGIAVLPTLVLADSDGIAYACLPGGAVNPEDPQDPEAIERKARLIDEAAMQKTKRDQALERAAGSTGLARRDLILEALGDMPTAMWKSDYSGQYSWLVAHYPDHPQVLEAVNASQLKDSRLALLDALADLPDLAGEHERVIGAVQDAIERIERLIHDGALDQQQKQAVLLSCLYPLYVKKTSLLHDGANSGALEAAFNRSIEILEIVRDMDKSSTHGQKAHALREELRRARLDAAKYD